jgi:polysaccharide biosynthesis transport protein
LREEYATIIIDTPPILGASEALVYAKQADIVLFCSLSEVSRSRQSRMAVDRLERSGANVVGAVMNGASLSRYPMAYGYDDVPLR